MTSDFENKQEPYSAEFRKLAKSVDALTVEVNELVCWKNRAQGMLIVVRWLLFVSLAYAIGSCVEKVTHEPVKATWSAAGQDPGAAVT